MKNKRAGEDRATDSQPIGNGSERQCSDGRGAVGKAVRIRSVRDSRRTAESEFVVQRPIPTVGSKPRIVGRIQGSGENPNAATPFSGFPVRCGDRSVGHTFTEVLRPPLSPRLTVRRPFGRVEEDECAPPGCARTATGCPDETAPPGRVPTCVAPCARCRTPGARRERRSRADAFIDRRRCWTLTTIWMHHGKRHERPEGRACSVRRGGI